MYCQFCKTELTSKRNKFCNLSCSAQHNNRLRVGTRSVESRLKTSKAVKGARKPLSQSMDCLWCKNNFLATREIGRGFKPFCSVKCSSTSRAEKCKAIALARGFGGYNSKKTEYQGVMFDSTWEVRIAKDLDANHVAWKRPEKMKLSSGQHYTPDFYLPSYDVYLDPKAYVHPHRVEDTSNRIALFEQDYKTKVIVITEEKNLSWSFIQNILAPTP